jgi:hypothetical protein
MPRKRKVAELVERSAEQSTEKSTEMNVVYEKGSKSYDYRNNHLHSETFTFWSRFMEAHINLQLFPANTTKMLKDDFVTIGGNKETIIAMKKLPMEIHGNIIAS